MSLRERRDVVMLCRSATPPQGVMFSVVQVAGSSYRQPGARMVALEDGRTTGTISGGCLEEDLLRRATWTVRDGAVVQHFSTAFDDASEVPYGLGCGGEVDVLAEPLATPEAQALLQAMAATLEGRPRVVATLLPAGAGAQSGTAATAGLRRMVLDEKDDVVFASDGLPTEDIVEMRHAARASAAAYDCSYSNQAFGNLFTERLRPVQRLVIFGAGDDARPLARIAVEMGWHVIVADTRSRRLEAARFPSATAMLAGTAAELPVQAADAVVLMTHSYTWDRQLLAELLTCDVAYLGLLGARHRSALLLQEASAVAGVSLHQAVMRTHAPVGLDLGGEGPEAVALAIVAEVQQVLAQREGRNARRLRPAEVERLLSDGPMIRYAKCSLDDTPQLCYPVAQ